VKIIKNGLLVTMDTERQIIRDGAVVVDGKFIKELGKAEPVSAHWPNAEIIDATNHIVLPGLINAHNHLFQVLLRGIGSGVPLSEWYRSAIWPLARYIGRHESYLAALLSSVEMLSSGTTTFVDSHYITRDKECYDGIAQAVEEIGIRGVIGRSTVDGDPVPVEFREPVDVAVREASRVIETYHGKADGRLTVRVEPLNESLASKTMVLAMNDLSRNYKVGFSMHIAETRERVELSREKYGYPPVEWLWNLGVLSPSVLLAHCVWVNDSEIHLLSSTKTKVVHNPICNQYLADGVAPVVEMLNSGVTVAVGTDGAASNNGQDIFEAMKSTVLLQRVSRLDAGALDAQKALEMVTIDAAKAIGMEDCIGSLEPGKLADIVLVDLEVPQLVPSVSALSNLVYAAPSRAVNLVMVNGRIVFKDGEVIALDQKELVRVCNRTVKSMIEQAGISHILNRGTWKIT
jgi:5-methylthioadenosine/S-adenosylhomocysteine deaminase